MGLTLIIVGAAALVLLIVFSIRRTRGRDGLEHHKITAEALRALMSSNRDILILDVRQPLDLLANSEIIPGARRIPPREALEKPWLIPKDEDAVVYCTCPSDKTSREVLRRVLSLHFSRVKFLSGGLAAWKAKGYPVETYAESFHLDTAK